jgi:1-acyl-sn-glycerol-3-phosphate acyltransferase
VEYVYPLTRALVKVPLDLGVRWTIEGAQTLPPHGPLLLATNHTSYLDPFAVAYLVDKKHRRARFLAKAELFDKQGLGAYLRAMGQIPVVRNSTSAAGSLEAAVDDLERGECVVVFPEGTISLDLDPAPARTGIARLAAQTGVPVTPVGMWGLHRILFKGRKPDWRWGVAETIVVGTPVRVAPDENVHDATDRVMTGIAACVARARAIYPQRAAPGEDDWWVRSPETARMRPASRQDAAAS